MKKPAKRLPKEFQGAAVLRGLGMKETELEDLETKALDQFDATQETWLVIEDSALGNEAAGVVQVFRDHADAVRYAQALSNGNINHRVLCVQGQTLVVATGNEL